MKKFTIAYGHFLFKHRNWIFPVVTALLLFGLPPSIDSVAMDLFGIALICCGAIIRALVVGLAYIKRGGIDKKIAADTLVTEGIFAHCRNPLYVGNLFISAGFLITHGNPLTMLIGGIFFLYSYHAIVAAEEGFLANKFGAAYTAYCQSTPRWGFRLSGLRATFSSMRFNWRRVIAKEYTTTFTWLLTLIGILAYEDLLPDGRIDHAASMLLALTVMTFSLLSIKHFKKSGALSAG